MRFVTIFFVIILFLSPANAQTAFFEALPDVPVAPGLVVMPDEAVSFDKPGGRIAEALARLNDNGIHAKPAAVYAYYAQILPAFGWEPAGARRYVRDGEALTFWFDSPAEGSAFHLLVQPVE